MLLLIKCLYSLLKIKTECIEIKTGAFALDYISSTDGQVMKLRFRTYERGNKKANIKHRSKGDSSSVTARMCFFTFSHGFFPRSAEGIRRFEWCPDTGWARRRRIPRDSGTDSCSREAAACSTAKNCNIRGPYFIYSLVYESELRVI